MRWSFTPLLSIILPTTTKKEFFSWQHWVYKSYGRAFLKSLEKEIKENKDLSWEKKKELLASLKKEVPSLKDKISKENASLVIDSPSSIHLLMSSYLLAGYRFFQGKEVEKRIAYSILEKAFLSLGGRWIRGFMKISLFFSRDPLKRIYQTSLRRAQKDYGDSFVFQHNYNGNSYLLKVKRCFYHDFFQKNGALELTFIFCSWDNHWAGEIDPKRHKLRFVRPYTLAEGARECSFEFYRVHKEGEDEG